MESATSKRCRRVLYVRLLGGFAFPCCVVPRLIGYGPLGSARHGDARKPACRSRGREGVCRGCPRGVPFIDTTGITRVTWVHTEIVQLCPAWGFCKPMGFHRGTCRGGVVLAWRAPRCRGRGIRVFAALDPSMSPMEPCKDWLWRRQLASLSRPLPWQANGSVEMPTCFFAFCPGGIPAVVIFDWAAGLQYCVFFMQRCV